jgi:biotin-dependent carboxylase-like uncharacterized protein
VIEVLKPGLQTTVQDMGRPGYLAMAMPPAGAMDQFAHQVANALVGNPGALATFEAALMGPTLTAQADVSVAVTGASVDVFVDDVEQPGWTALSLRAGQVLRLGMMRHGARAYIAFSGGIDVPVVMGSRSTYMLTATGGHEGRPLRAGDVLTVGRARTTPQAGRALRRDLRPIPGSEFEVRLVLGLAAYRFTPESLRAFTEREYTLSHESNRTGYRFIGEPLAFVPRKAPFGAGDNPSNVVSFGYPLGSIQVPNGEEPICLMRDAVTGGGFATLGTVITADLDLLGQAKATDTVRFTAVDIDAALRLRRERTQRIARTLATLSDHPEE